MPAGAVDADRHLARERAFADLAVEGGTGKPGAGQHGLETDNPFFVTHGTDFHSMTVDEAP